LTTPSPWWDRDVYVDRRAFLLARGRIALQGLLQRLAAGEPALVRLGSAQGFDVFLDLTPSTANGSTAAAGSAPAPGFRPAVLRTVY